MRIGLMTNIPHDTVVWCVIDIMQGHGQFDYAKARRKVSGMSRNLVDNELSQSSADVFELALWQGS